jgi:hypothetical protein
MQFRFRESAMTMRRKIVQTQLSIFLSALIATTPYTLKVSDFAFELTPQTVHAKNGNNGNGGGNGNGNGGGNGSQGGGKSETRGSSEGAKDHGATSKGSAVGLSVRHGDGISEVVRNGRYIMRDSKGRTIVNRRATLADEIRLQYLRR